MVFTMNAFMAAADILGSRILEINEQIITRLSLLERAARIAKDAAPFVHPRLVQVELGNGTTGSYRSRLI